MLYKSLTSFKEKGNRLVISKDKVALSYSCAVDRRTPYVSESLFRVLLLMTRTNRNQQKACGNQMSYIWVTSSADRLSARIPNSWFPLLSVVVLNLTCHSLLIHSATVCLSMH